MAFLTTSDLSGVYWKSFDPLNQPEALNIKDPAWGDVRPPGSLLTTWGGDEYRTVGDDIVPASDWTQDVQVDPSTALVAGCDHCGMSVFLPTAVERPTALACPQCGGPLQLHSPPNLHHKYGLMNWKLGLDAWMNNIGSE